MIASRLPWVAAAAASVLVGIASILAPVGDPGASLLYEIAITTFTLVGALLITRVPGNKVGGLLLAAGLIMSIDDLAGLYAELGGAASPIWPGVALAAVLNQVTYFYPIVIVLIGVPLVFPDGRLLSPRWRWLVILTVAAMTAVTLDGLFRPAGLGVAGDIANPLGIPALVPILDALSLFTSLVSVVGFGGAAVSVVIRYRRAGTVERQQLKWLLAAAGVACVAFPVSIIMSDTPVSNALFLVGFFALIALPLAIGIAILRYRLYEIDRIISRTIGWAVVTGALVAVYLIAVLVLQWALGGLTNGDTIAVAVSTLVAAATFQPIRMRTQRAVDRRFDRARFDGERTAIAFAERLRSQAAIDSVATDLQSTVGVALRPASQGLWLRRAPE